VPQFTFPHALLTSPQVAPLHDGGVHDVHVPLWQVVIAPQPAHCTFPLPHALGCAPHADPTPPSASAHSGGGASQSPPKHDCPAGQLHCFVCPHPSVSVPQ
jgi:hypothetical protein